MTDTTPQALRALADRLSRLSIIDEVGSDNPLGRDAAATLRALAAEKEAAPTAEWIWYGEEEDGTRRLTFGRWQKHACQSRYVPETAARDARRAALEAFVVSFDKLVSAIEEAGEDGGCWDADPLWGPVMRARALIDREPEPVVDAAALVRETMQRFEPGPAHLALEIAARAVERGRHLTPGEQLENLKAALFDEPAAPTPTEPTHDTRRIQGDPQGPRPISREMGRMAGPHPLARVRDRARRGAAEPMRDDPRHPLSRGRATAKLSQGRASDKARMN